MRPRSGVGIALAILLLATPLSVGAQSPLAVLSVGNGSGLPGASDIAVPVSLDSQDGAEVAGVNFDLAFDSLRLEVSSVDIGSAASSAGKTLSFSRPSAGRIRVIIFGVNQDAIPDGTIAVLRFNVLGSASPGTSSLTLSNVTAGHPSGGSVPVDVSNGSFTVLSPPVVDTPTWTATATLTATRTATITLTATATRTATRTRTPTRTPTSTAAGGATATSPSMSRTPTRTRTPGPSSTPALPSATPAVVATSTTAPSLAPPATESPSGAAPGMTPTPFGTDPPELGTAVAATLTAMAEFDAAVLATVTALAPPPEQGSSGNQAGGAQTLLSGGWLWVLLIGLAFLGVVVLAAAGFVLWRQNSNRGGPGSTPPT